MIGITTSAQHTPTVGKVYDFEIGDLFHYKIYNRNLYSYAECESNSWSDVLIVDKTYEEDSSTITYTFNISTTTNSHCAHQQHLNNWHQYDADSTVIVTNLDSTILYNKSLEGDSVKWIGDSIYTDPDKYNGKRITNYYNYGIPISVFYHIDESFVAGLGTVNYYKSEGGIRKEYVLKYYRKERAVWREHDLSQLNVSSFFSDLIHKPYSIFPNPTSASLFIHLNDVNDGIIKVHNLKGQELFKGEIVPGMSRYSFSPKEKGAFILTIQTKDTIFTKRVLVK